MTAGELRKKLARVPDAMEIVVRVPADEEMNGNCFALAGVSIGNDHVTGEDFIAFDCDQECDLSGTGFLPVASDKVGP